MQERGGHYAVQLSGIDVMHLSNQPLATGHIVSKNSYSCSQQATSIPSIARSCSKKMCGHTNRSAAAGQTTMRLSFRTCATVH